MPDDEDLEEKTRRVLATLTPREEEVLRRRFGIGEKILEEGQDFEETRVRIRQIEERALSKLQRRTAPEAKAKDDDDDRI